VKVQILGSGCARCKALEANARAALADLGIDAEVEKISDVATIASMGVMMTPGFAIDGVVKSVGRVLAKGQVASLLRGERE
jgi:small redox-active disulfide protein 2